MKKKKSSKKRKRKTQHTCAGRADIFTGVARGTDLHAPARGRQHGLERRARQLGRDDLARGDVGVGVPRRRDVEQQDLLQVAGRAAEQARDGGPAGLNEFVKGLVVLACGRGGVGGGLVEEEEE